MTERATGDVEFQGLWLRAYQTAYRILQNREDAEDVAVEAVAQLHARRNRPPTNPMAWITTVAANRAISVWRKDRARANMQIQANLAPPSEEPYTRVELLHELERLPPRQRETLILRYLFDFSEAETASQLGVTAGSVKQHTSRGLASLRRSMNGETQEREPDVRRPQSS